jgi:hypothetical protein
MKRRKNYQAPERKKIICIHAPHTFLNELAHVAMEISRGDFNSGVKVLDLAQHSTTEIRLVVYGPAENLEILFDSAKVTAASNYGILPPLIWSHYLAASLLDLPTEEPD